MAEVNPNRVFCSENAAGMATHDYSFNHSLHQLRLQLDDMNRRTAALLLRHQQDHDQHDVQTNTLVLPSGPAFWQLYRALRTDIRGLDARIELIEDRIADLSNRLDAIEPLRTTPPPSPVLPSHVPALANEAKVAESGETYSTSSNKDNLASCQEQPGKPCAELVDVGRFDPTVDDNNEDQTLTTSDVMTFIAKLKRVSRTKRIIDPEQFLGGPALQLYRLGYSSDGNNVYDDSDGCLDVNIFDKALLSLFKPDALRLLRSETYTLADLASGRRLVEDYAFKMLSLGRYLEGHDPAENWKLTFECIRQGISIPGDSSILADMEGSSDSLPELFAKLRMLESSLKHNHQDAHTAHENLQDPTANLHNVEVPCSEDQVDNNSYEGELTPCQLEYNMGALGARELPRSPMSSIQRGSWSHTGPGLTDTQRQLSEPVAYEFESVAREDRNFRQHENTSGKRDRRLGTTAEVYGKAPWSQPERPEDNTRTHSSYIPGPRPSPWVRESGFKNIASHFYRTLSDASGGHAKSPRRTISTVAHEDLAEKGMAANDFTDNCLPIAPPWSQARGAALAPPLRWNEARSGPLRFQARVDSDDDCV